MIGGRNMLSLFIAEVTTHTLGAMEAFKGGNHVNIEKACMLFNAYLHDWWCIYVVSLFMSQVTTSLERAMSALKEGTMSLREGVCAVLRLLA